MNNLDLNSERTLTLKLGHAFLAWYVLLELTGQTDFKSVFNAVEQKAVWALEDHLERMLESEGLLYSEMEFSQIQKDLEEFVESHIDADFA
ncbi:MAG TPA: hypothetical protein DDW52_04395 [Planctomycetaceae bacterium]|nr:hypothetical protein [Planctomycetaceae bacterium]